VTEFGKTKVIKDFYSRGWMPYCAAGEQQLGYLGAALITRLWRGGALLVTPTGAMLTTNIEARWKGRGAGSSGLKSSNPGSQPR
jgi:hypothetical protein